MSRLVRLVAVVAGSALVITGAVAGLVSVGVGLLHHSASADVLPLAPLNADSALGGSTVYADDGTTVLAVLHASEDRKPVPLSKVSPVLVTAVLDTEDHRFFVHGGFDIPSMIRALAADSSSSGGFQGGSTIAQQLVKNEYLTSERTLSRKIKEAVLADRLERKYTKDQILDAYLNSIYLGNGSYGVEAAANKYFGEHASQVTLAQAALLAGLIQNPSGYDPIYNPAGARDRRSEVLARIVHYGDATAAQAAAANRTPLPTAIIQPPVGGDQITDYYVQQIETQLLSSGSPLGTTYQERYQALFEGGLKIYTNLDPTLQAGAEQVIARDTPPNRGGFQEAMVAMDPTTGKVRALVGGLGVHTSQYDIVTHTGGRQPGSGFKIFTLLAALEQGYSIYDTLDGQSPCAIDFPTDHDLLTKPANNDEGNGGGIMTLLNATAQSTNCAFIRLAHEVGLPNVVAMAHRLGITENLPLYPSIVIGSIPVRPIEMAAAYATIADDGVYHAPSFIDHIVDRAGTTIYTGADSGHQVIPPQIAREATLAFQAVIQNGTGTAGQLYGRPAAGKTGTTSSYTDAWFNGFTPQIETTVWMGNEASTRSMAPYDPNFGFTGLPYDVYGGTFPTHTWHDFMSLALVDQPVEPFTPPDYAILPAAKYITSPGLVRDDVLDHNYGGPPIRPNPGAGHYPNNSTTTASTLPTVTTAPTSPPSSAPPSTVPRHKRKK
jgi:penicillin-binding protein 1A